MDRHTFCLVAWVGLLGCAFVASQPARPARASVLAGSFDSGRNVIFVSWDGVRRQEFLGAADPSLGAASSASTMPYFWQSLAPTGVIYGDPRLGQMMTIGNLAFLSMPAYQSIFTGTPKLYGSSRRVSTTTFPERLRDELGLAPEKIATFASWNALPLAVEAQPGATYTNAGIQAVHERGDAEEDQLNTQQQDDRPPWSDARYDVYTWRQAMSHLNRHRPRFMYISLNDSDEWGHQQDYPHYLQALQNYDQWLQGLVEHLGRMGEYGKRTCLVVTTDHGRGDGSLWYEHDRANISSGLVLMYAGCPLAAGPSPMHPAEAWTSHLDIRPTIETLFGLKPAECLLCGHSLAQPDEMQSLALE